MPYNDNTEYNSVNSRLEDDDSRDDARKAAAYSNAAKNSARDSAQKAAEEFAKPNEYTGNRKLYDDGRAKANAKSKLFRDGVTVRDPYTNKKLVLTKKEAKLMFGDNWTEHLAESDHIRPLEQIFEDTAHSPWVTTDDIKAAANNPDNIRVTSRKTNNAKRSRTNEQFVKDVDYRKSKSVKFTNDGELTALRDGDAANQSIRHRIFGSSVKNIFRTGHEAGMSGAQSAGLTAVTMSGIMNIVDVINGKKDAREAVADTAKDAGNAVVAGYTVSSGLTVISHSFTNSNSEFLKALSKYNIPSKVITSVMVIGNTLMRYGNGEITTQQCLIELGDRGLNFATMGYSMAAGQAMIPIPVVGGVIGALVGSMLTSNYYHSLIDALTQKEFEHQERMRIIAECHEAAEQTKAFRLELEEYLKKYFDEYQECFDTAISSMQFSFQSGDADGVIASANMITSKLGGKVNFRTVDEFKEFFDNTEIDII